MTLEQESEGNDGGSHVDNQGKGIPGRKNSRCKGPEVEVCHHGDRSGVNKGACGRKWSGIINTHDATETFPELKVDTLRIVSVQVGRWRCKEVPRSHTQQVAETGFEPEVIRPRAKL